MKPAATLGLYGAALAVVFTAALGLGSVAGPVGAAPSEPSHGTDHPADDSGHGGGHAAPATSDDVAPGGLAVSQDGYTLQLARTTVSAGRPGRLQFAVAGPDGERLTDFTPSHDKELHLVVVRRDLTGYQHLHPTRDAEGRWAVPLTLAEPGPYKVFADFVPAGRERPLILAADLAAPGTYAPAALPPASESASVDGYDVTRSGRLVAGASSRLTFTVTKGGRPVTDLQPYLGAYGHLVALREGDLAYLHVHPEDGPAGPDVTFSADVPSAATYRLFLDFSHGGEVRTAASTATAVR